MFLRNLIAVGLLIAGLGSGALVAPAAAAPAMAAIDPVANRALCDQLALAVTPDSMIPIQIDAMLVSMGRQMLAAGGPMVEMERAYPGLVDAIVTASRPVMVRGATRMMPDYRADVSTLYC